MMVAVSGSPGTAAAVTVTGPGSYTHSVSATETLSELALGGYTVTAQAVSGGGHSYQPSVGSQNVTVSEVAVASATITYSEVGAGGGSNLRIDGMYLTQSVQPTAAVDLVKDRDGYWGLRHRQPVQPRRPGGAGPLHVEGCWPRNPPSPRRGRSSAQPERGHPGDVVERCGAQDRTQPNLSIQAEADPSNVVAESNESDGVSRPPELRWRWMSEPRRPSASRWCRSVRPSTDASAT